MTPECDGHIIDGPEKPLIDALAANGINVVNSEGIRRSVSYYKIEIGDERYYGRTSALPTIPIIVVGPEASSPENNKVVLRASATSNMSDISEPFLSISDLTSNVLIKKFSISYYRDAMWKALDPYGNDEYLLFSDPDFAPKDFPLHVLVISYETPKPQEKPVKPIIHSVAVNQRYMEAFDNDGRLIDSKKLEVEKKKQLQKKIDTALAGRVFDPDKDSEVKTLPARFDGTPEGNSALFKHLWKRLPLTNISETGSLGGPKFSVETSRSSGLRPFESTIFNGELVISIFPVYIPQDGGNSKIQLLLRPSEQKMEGRLIISINSNSGILTTSAIAQRLTSGKYDIANVDVRYFADPLHILQICEATTVTPAELHNKKAQYQPRSFEKPEKQMPYTTRGVKNPYKDSPGGRKPKKQEGSGKAHRRHMKG